ncbi:MAG: hypothetical protein JKX78_06795 [Alteromonadaceae bacterium]|nr:hypothetical protein [Alteromonadaceae bacterium]
MINSQLEVLTQAKDYLNTVSTHHYNEVIKPNFISSAGAHIRHIIDHYQAIILGLENKHIDYDKRERHSDIETTPSIALAKIVNISQWLTSLTADQLSNLVTLSTEVSISNCQVETVKTTVARELVFAASHAVHHYAMIAQIALQQQHTLPLHFGIAPATATYLREQANKPH